MLPDKANRLIEVMNGKKEPANDLEAAFKAAFDLETSPRSQYEDLDKLLLRFDILNIMDTKEGMVLLGLMVGKKTNMEVAKKKAHDPDDKLH